MCVCVYAGALSLARACGCGRAGADVRVRASAPVRETVRMRARACAKVCLRMRACARSRACLWVCAWVVGMRVRGEGRGGGGVVTEAEALEELVQAVGGGERRNGPALARQRPEVHPEDDATPPPPHIPHQRQGSIAVGEGRKPPIAGWRRRKSKQERGR